MTIHSLWVINKAGGLVFSRYYSDTLPPLALNTILILAGTLHGVHAITARLSPTTAGPLAGLDSFEAEGWGAKVFLTATGTKFVVLHSLGQHGLDELLERVYEIYADAVMKNPFHTPEMPINSALFESRLAALMTTTNA
ncbi:hypothetical protein Q5752_007028 [Cryptotrichosporon argae]